MGKISETQRVRIILDLIKDGDVADTSNYAGLDIASTDLATDIGEKFWTAYQKTDPAEATNKEMAMNLLNVLREYIGDIRQSERVKKKRRTAEDDEKEAAKADNENDLGTKEEIEKEEVRA